MAWLPAIASIAGSLISASGQRDTNATNQNIQQENSAFNAYQAQLNRDWQAHQSNTVWQRGVNDMQAAGLNPMLAYSQGGNPAASGGAASAGAPGNQVNPYAAAGQSAGQWAQITKTQAEARLIEAQADELESTLIDEKGNTKHGKGPLWNSLKAAKMNSETGEIVARTMQHVAQEKVTVEQKKLVEQQIKNLIEENPRIQADAALKRINEILLKLDVPRMQAESRYFKSPVGRESPHNKYGPQTPFRFLEGLGERIINRWSAN